MGIMEDFIQYNSMMYHVFFNLDKNSSLRVSCLVFLKHIVLFGVCKVFAIQFKGTRFFFDSLFESPLEHGELDGVCI